MRAGNRVVGQAPFFQSRRIFLQRLATAKVAGATRAVVAPVERAVAKGTMLVFEGNALVIPLPFHFHHAALRQVTQVLLLQHLGRREEACAPPHEQRGTRHGQRLPRPRWQNGAIEAQGAIRYCQNGIGLVWTPAAVEGRRPEFHR